MWSRVAPFAAWLWIINILTNVYEVADRNMLLHLSAGSAAQAQASVGQYHSARIIPLLLVGIAAMLGGILAPYLTAHWENGQHSRAVSQLRWTLKLVALGFIAGGFGILVGAPALFEHVLHGEYDDGLAVLPLTLVYCIWLGLIVVGQDYLWCREKGKWACTATLAGLAINIGLNFLLIPRFGLNGAVWSTAVSIFVALMATYLVNQRFGWTTDKGIWVTAFAPLILLAPIHTGLVALISVCWCGCKYGWIFDQQEMEEIGSAIRSALNTANVKRRCLDTAAEAQ